MASEPLLHAYRDLSTPHVADACMRLGIPVRCTPSTIRPLWTGTHVAGQACPVRHFGSVDVFLEAIDRAKPGNVLVADNGGRLDEACIGDLVTLEASCAGLAGIVIWGLHRDSSELEDIRLPVFSLGALPVGPQRLDSRNHLTFASAVCGDHNITAFDFVLGDDDGVVFLPLDRASEIAKLATNIRNTERNQATHMRRGTSFRQQARFDEYITARRLDATLTFRQHLRSTGGEIEE